MKDTNLILSKIKEFRNNTLAFFTAYMPEAGEIRAKIPSRAKLTIQDIILRIWLLIQPFIFRRKLPKYVFISKVFPHIMSTLQPKEVMVMGGRKELIFCLKNGYRFYWLGAIFYGFNQFIFSEKNNLFSLVVVSLRKMFSKDINKRYLFLCDDSLPEGMTLSFALESIPNLNIVCIAHGIINFEPSRIKIIPEGISCKFNLLWDKSQKFFFKDDKNHASFVLGLPYEVSLPKNHCREVILVGDCGLSSNAVRYFYALYVFCKIYRILEAAGIDVSYRPHPQDDIEYVQSIFSNVCITQKNELLTSNRKVFIGYESSLIFEAGNFGHTTIGLDALELMESKYFEHKDNRAFDVDFEVSSDNFENLPSLVLDIFEKSIFAEVDEIKNLKSRFNKCLNQIDDFSLTNESASLIV